MVQSKVWQERENSGLGGNGGQVTWADLGQS